MTNPGHIDPGFKGHLRFTVINMGKKSFNLRRGDTIVTCLLIRLQAPATMNYAAQGHNPTGDRPPRREIEHLSRDFLDFTKRASTIATEVTNAHLEDYRRTTVRRDVVVTAVGAAALILALAAAAVPAYLSFMPPIMELKERSAEMKTALKSLEDKINEMASSRGANPR